MWTSENSMKICHIIGIFSPEHGGPVVSCRNYCMAQLERGLDVSLFTLEGYRKTSPAVRLPAGISQRIERVDQPEKLGSSTRLRKAIFSNKAYDVYHLHGIWLKSMYYGYQHAVTHKRPYLVEINGALDPLELATKSWRKRFIRLWYQNRILREASCLHVNSLREAEHVRALGFSAPIAIIPAGFNVSEAESISEKAKRDFPAWSEALKGKRILLYLARIHPAKGVDDLLRAWEKIADKFSDWALLLIGPGEHKELTKWTATNANDASKRVYWVGMVPEVEKVWAFSKAEVYVLPSHKENFGNTVQEALGHGTPVITTKKTPWLDLPDWGCGWVCDDNSCDLTETLEDALSKSSEQLKAMGKIGRNIVVEKFSLEKAVADQISVYKWLHGDVCPPHILKS